MTEKEYNELFNENKDNDLWELLHLTKFKKCDYCEGKGKIIIPEPGCASLTPTTCPECKGHCVINVMELDQNEEF